MNINKNKHTLSSLYDYDKKGEDESRSLLL